VFHSAAAFFFLQHPQPGRATFSLALCQLFNTWLIPSTAVFSCPRPALPLTFTFTNLPATLNRITDFQIEGESLTTPVGISCQFRKPLQTVWQA